jgi:ABC-type transport system involved in multi-copper enzyme maturation permease subunit
VILVYAALAWGGWLGGGMAVAGGMLLLLAAYSRRDGVLLVGPFAGWDLVRTARRPRLHLWRAVLGVGCLVLVGKTLDGYTGWLTDESLAADLTRADTTAAASHAFYLLGGCTIAFAALFAVANLPAVVAEEREANRLDHLLVTDLRDREILLGKVAGRTAVLLGYAAVPLPVLALLTLFGGVSPPLVLTAGVMTVAGLLGLTGVCVGCSAAARTAGAATRYAVVVLTVLYCGTLILDGLADRLTLVPGEVPELDRRTIRALEATADGLRFLAKLNPVSLVQRLDTLTEQGVDDAEIVRELRTTRPGSGCCSRRAGGSPPGRSGGRRPRPRPAGAGGGSAAGRPGRRSATPRCSGTSSTAAGGWAGCSAGCSASTGGRCGG